MPLSLASSPDLALRFRHTFHGSYALVRQMLRRLGLDEGLAEDGAQQVFIVLLERMSSVERGKERAFVCSCARLVGRRLRARAVRAQGLAHEPEGDGPQADELVDARRRRELVEQLLGRMDADLRAVLVLAEIEGKGKREIAAHLGIAEGTAASRLRRAREDLHARLFASQKRAPTATPRSTPFTLHVSTPARSNRCEGPLASS